MSDNGDQPDYKKIKLAIIISGVFLFMSAFAVLLLYYAGIEFIANIEGDIEKWAFTVSGAGAFLIIVYFVLIKGFKIIMGILPVLVILGLSAAFVVNLFFGNGGSGVSTVPTEVVTENIDGIIQLPPPSQLPYALPVTDAAFDKSLIHSMDDIPYYNRDSVKASLNFGVYLTDIGYLVSFEEQQLAMNYFAETIELGGAIGFKADRDVIYSFESNIDNKDSLIYLMSATMGASYWENYDKSKQIQIMTGAHVEGLHLAAGSLQKHGEYSPETQEILFETYLRILDHQISGSKTLISYRDSLFLDPYTRRLLYDLDSLNSDYLILRDSISQVSGFEVEALKTVFEAVSQIRNKITSTEKE